MVDSTDFLKPIVDPWYRSLAEPVKAQEETLRKLLEGYSGTDYGKSHNAGGIGSVKAFQESFPIVKYSDLMPYIEAVKAGNYSALLPEPAVRWVMTRGTTGVSKLIPATETHLAEILSNGARAIVNHALRRGDTRVLEGGVLNLNFPSEVGMLNTPKGDEPYGYSSGTYAKFHPELGSAGLVPRQEEIDRLGGGIKKQDWERRFELVYQRAREQDVKSTMGVAPVITAFAEYVRKKHRVSPKDLWRIEAILCTSVPKIQTIYAPYLRKLYGNAPVVEMYTATEGVFAQQLDERPYVCPNYDTHFFEVLTRRGVRQLHELEAGEWGRLVISGSLFPRYDIGDMVEYMGKGYFRIFGRASRRTVLEHILFNIISGRIRWAVPFS